MRGVPSCIASSCRLSVDRCPPRTGKHGQQYAPCSRPSSSISTARFRIGRRRGDRAQRGSCSTPSTSASPTRRRRIVPGTTWSSGGAPEAAALAPSAPAPRVPSGDAGAALQGPPVRPLRSPRPLGGAPDRRREHRLRALGGRRDLRPGLWCGARAPPLRRARRAMPCLSAGDARPGRPWPGPRLRRGRRAGDPRRLSPSGHRRPASSAPLRAPRCSSRSSPPSP